MKSALIIDIATSDPFLCYEESIHLLLKAGHRHADAS